MSTAAPTIDIVVPTYRRPDLLSTCLNSLHTQTFSDFRVLICDNAADPGTADIVAGFDDDRFVYAPREANLGILGNVIEGYRQSNGHFVMELDDDDYLAPRCLERLVSPLLANTEIALSFSDMEIIDERGRVVPDSIRHTKIQVDRHLREGLYDQFTELAARGFVFTVAALWRRDAVDWADIPEQAATAYDRYLTVAAARGGRPAYYVDERLAYYRVHPNADSEQHFVEQWQGAMFVLQEALQRATPTEASILNTEIVNLRVEMARFLIRERHWRDATQALLSAIRTPACPRYIAHYARRCAARVRRKFPTH